MADGAKRGRLPDIAPEKQAAYSRTIERFIQDSFDGNVETAVQEFRRYLLSSRQSGSGNASAQRNQESVADTSILLSVKSLTKEYKRGRQRIPVLNGISLDIHEGEIVAITGASGSGKSTLLQILGGLDKPTAGEVLYSGTNLAKLSDSKLSAFRRQTVGFVFQFFYLQPFLKLERNLEVPGMFSRTKRAERRQQSERLAEKVGLSDRLAHLPRELSGGQMQRAAIARALFNKPKIILADEPTGNLDSKNGQAIIELFEAIREELGTTIIIVTHDEAIARRADRIIHIKDGMLA